MCDQIHNMPSGQGTRTWGKAAAEFSGVPSSELLQLHVLYTGKHVNNYIHEAAGCLRERVVKKQLYLRP